MEWVGLSYPHRLDWIGLGWVDSGLIVFVSFSLVGPIAVPKLTQKAKYQRINITGA